ncbi:MAG: DUF4838 domain-containing protein [bacterium]|nr:DUF4838 domain-containing protein [bacterium]
MKHGPAVLAGLTAALSLAAPAPCAVELVRDGQAVAVIHLPAAATPAAAAVADTLRGFLRRISGADLPVVPHDAPPAGGLVLEEGGAAASALGEEGFRLHSGPGRVTLTAGTERGLAHAAYTLLETWLGCRMYSPEVVVLPRRSTVTLPEMDDTQVPPLSFRLQDFQEPAYAAWHKLSSRREWGLFVHTFQELVPPARWFPDHPEYFSEHQGGRVADGQLCLSQPAVLEIVVAELERRMREQPDARYWSVSQNDTWMPCTCAGCRAVDEAEGSPAGSLLRFVNQVAARFPDQVISTLAYQYSRPAPRLTRPRPNVNIMLCSIECDRSRPIAQDPRDTSFVRDLQDWSRLTDNILVWDYVIQFRNLVSPFPNLRVLQPNLRFFAGQGVTAVFEQGLPVLKGEFAELRAYLLAKLLWNPELDFDAVLDDFLAGFYGEAAPHLRRYIDAMHEALAASGEDLSCFGHPLPTEDGYLSGAQLDHYDKLFDLAEAAVAHRPEVAARVRTARLPLIYAQIEQGLILADAGRGCFLRGAGGRRSVRPGFREQLAAFHDGCAAAGIPRLWEHGLPPDEYRERALRFLAEGERPHLALGCPVALERPASATYRGGDPGALTDGLLGWSDYHFHWLGCEGEDLAAVIDLGAERSVTRVEAAFLQDIASWVFLPRQVEIQLSRDGITYETVGRQAARLAPMREGAVQEAFAAAFAARPARYVRLRAENMKSCPAWHKGSGGKAWVFCDEIRVF